MILIRAGMKERSTEQTLIHEMVHAKLFWIRKEIHGKRIISELRRLRKLGAPLSSLELDKVRSDSVTSREPARLTKKRVCSLIFEALTNEGLTAMALPRYLEQELMVPYSSINSSVDVKREAKKLTELIKKNQSTVHNACF
jgi:tRNA isopentenyl-2-thiomethyl-A-37 hydroxylase MiaE